MTTEATTYVFSRYPLLSRACDVVSDTMQDAPYGALDPVIVARVAYAMRCADGGHKITMTPNERDAFRDCFIIATKDNADWSDEDYNAVLATLGEGA